MVDAVVDEDGRALADDTPIVLAEDTVKTVLLGGARVVPVARIAGGTNGPIWSTLTKKQIKRF